MIKKITDCFSVCLPCLLVENRLKPPQCPRLLHCACVGFENPITQADSRTPIFTSKHSWM